MNEISTQTKQTMSSLEIAKLTGKEHPKVTSDIKRILSEVEIDAAVFGCTYKDSNNRDQSAFNLPRRECDLIIAGYSAKYRLAIIDRWQELESAQTKTLPSYAETLRLYADSLDKILEKDKLIVATNQAQIAAGEILVREFCKSNDIVDIGEHQFWRWMVAGCVRWQQIGLAGTPRRIVVATDDFRASMDILGCWLKERCVIGDTLEAPISNLYINFQTWAVENQQHVWNKQSFGRRLTDHKFGKRESHGITYRVGLGLRLS